MIAAFCVVIALTTMPAEDPPADKVFVGYLFGPPRNINFKLYTHLCHAFLTANADGTLRKERGVPNPDLTAQAHKAGVKVLISLGGWGYDEQFAAITAHPEAEDRYVKGVIALIDSADYDGLDLDWEYPNTKAEIVGFEHLTRRFRKELDAIAARKGRPMLITMAASADPGTLRWLDKAFLLKTMDWINVMTYDYAGEWANHAGHNAPLFASSKEPGKGHLSIERTMKFLVEDRQIPANRLALGLPLYGRGFAVSEPYASTKDVARKRMPAGEYSNIDKLWHEKNWTRLWDEQTKVPWLIAPDKSSVIGYDDAQSIAIKAEWARKQGFKGVFFWQINGDRMSDGSNPLQQAAKQALSGDLKAGKP
jgi:chitinase